MLQIINPNVLKWVKDCLVAEAIKRETLGRCDKGAPEKIKAILAAQAANVFPPDYGFCDVQLMSKIRESIGENYSLPQDLSLLTLIMQNELTVADVCEHIACHAMSNQNR